MKKIRTKKYLTIICVIVSGLCYTSCLSDGDETVALEIGNGKSDYELAGIIPETSRNPTIPTSTVLIPSGVNFTPGAINNVPVVRADLPGVPHPNGGWIQLVGTGYPGHNIWLEVDDEPHGILIEKVTTQKTMAADIVFVVDNSGSMSEEADAVARDIISWASSLEMAGLNARFACVGYSESGTINGAIDLTTATNLSSYLNRQSGTKRTVGFSGSNSQQLTSAASAYRVTGECGAMAVRYADATFSFRNSVNRYYVNFTDEPNQPNMKTDFSVEFFKNNWSSVQGTIYTVFSGSLSSSWTTNVNEDPRKMSEYTGGTSINTNSDFRNVDLNSLPITGALQNSYYVYFTDIRKLLDGKAHKVKLTIYSADGVASERIFYVNFGTL